MMEKMFNNTNKDSYLLSEEDYLILHNKYTKLLHSVMVSRVLKAMLPKEIEECRGIYERCGYKLTNPRCSSCVFNMMERLAKQYYFEEEKRMKRAVLDEQKEVKKIRKTKTKKKE